MTHQKTILDSLVQLKKHIEAHPISSGLIAHAIEANPWYTDYYITHSLNHILKWLDRKRLESFTSRYPESKTKPLSIGIITAGNVPFVGFHDILIAILAGHKAVIRPSHQDRVLLNWIMQQWSKVYPGLQNQFKFSRDFESIDYLIATGSNTTARYIDFHYQNIPRLIRHNRFSIAVLDKDCTDFQLEKLNKDIFLYNGLGCRNVSQVVVFPGFDEKKWLNQLASYQVDSLNKAYLSKVAFERARLVNCDIDFIDGHFVLIVSGQEFSPQAMGIINLLRINDEENLKQLLVTYENQIQCIVNRGMKFGQTQYPDIDEFADEADTMQILTTI